MSIIANLKELKRIEKKFKCKFDHKHRYCTDSGEIENNLSVQRELAKEGYKLKYFDGCFNPFLVDVSDSKGGFIFGWV